MFLPVRLAHLVHSLTGPVVPLYPLSKFIILLQQKVNQPHRYKPFNTRSIPTTEPHPLLSNPPFLPFSSRCKPTINRITKPQCSAFSRRKPSINRITSPSRIRALIAQQERNQAGHLVRRAHSIDTLAVVDPRIDLSPHLHHHGGVDWSASAKVNFIVL